MRLFFNGPQCLSEKKYQKLAAFVFCITYFHQTFIKYVPFQYKHFD